MIDMMMLLLLMQLHAPKSLNDQPIPSISQFTTLLEKEEANKNKNKMIDHHRRRHHGLDLDFSSAIQEVMVIWVMEVVALDSGGMMII
jgi:hypothetical protein